MPTRVKRKYLAIDPWWANRTRCELASVVRMAPPPANWAAWTALPLSFPSQLYYTLSLSLSLSVTHTHTHSPLVHLTPLYANATPVFLSVEYRFFCFLLLVKWWNELLLCKWAAPIDCVSLTFALLIFSCARSENRLLALVPISISQLSILLPRRSIMIALL